MSRDLQSPVDLSSGGSQRQVCAKLRMPAPDRDRTIQDSTGRLQAPAVNEMSSQGNPHSADVTSSPEYQELVRLKVILEVETSRQLAETAHVSAELERSSLAEETSSVRADR